MDLADHTVQLGDTMSAAIYDRHGGELLTTGLYLDVPAYGYHVFEVDQPS